MTAMTASALALLHHLQSAERGEQLPKHVAAELEALGLVRSHGASPGDVELTRAGTARLQGLQEEHANSDRIQP
jgi:hypothetical protein